MKYLFGIKLGLLVILNENEKLEEIMWCEEIIGKLDLVVFLDFRMIVIFLYFDIVLLVVIWYEKYDLLFIDMYLYVYFFNLVIDLLWELCLDWDIYKMLVKVFLEMVKDYLFGMFKDVVIILFSYDIK